MLPGVHAPRLKWSLLCSTAASASSVKNWCDAHLLICRSGKGEAVTVRWPGLQHEPGRLNGREDVLQQGCVGARKELPLLSRIFLHSRCPASALGLEAVWRFIRKPGFDSAHCAVLYGSMLAAAKGSHHPSRPLHAYFAVPNSASRTLAHPP